MLQRSLSFSFGSFLSFFDTKVSRFQQIWAILERIEKEVFTEEVDPRIMKLILESIGFVDLATEANNAMEV